MTTASGHNVVDVVRETILIGVVQKNFRNGAFVSLITENTPVIDSLNILIAFSHLSTSEKEIDQACRDEFITFRNQYPGNERPDLNAATLLGNRVNMLTEIFNTDAAARGLYVPPQMMLQTMNADGTVKESTAINNDDTSTVTQGDTPGVPPGAPEEYVAMQAENTRLFNAAANGAAATEASTADTSNTNPSEENNNLDFGRAFSRNIRRAFM